MPVQYDTGDEGTHDIGTTDPHWQESVFVHWYDLAAGIGGVHRLGHEPNAAPGGRAALQCALFRSDGLRYRRSNDELPMREPRTKRGFRAGGSEWHVDGPVPRIEVHEPGLDLELELHDFYPITSFFPSSGSLVEEFAAHHYESSGRAVGTVTVQGATRPVEATFHRDHSWGVRKTATLLSHRWVSGTFGPALSFGSTVWHAADGSFVKVGYVVRDGEITFAEDVDVVTYMEPDAYTHRGGVVTWYLPGGEELRLEAELIDGVAAKLHSAHYVDSLCRVTHEGRTAVCDFEISNNARNGSTAPSLSLAANHTEGFSQR
ncbi:hypothetical protein GCM10023321_32400 [Pseudonocardia eucalypti]|uniref:Uncharacterized protein n=1 Tax=Pseudonocardia eucalypti TaxID=648755 RepID=A0ABP9Q9G6_9PSEU|nr:hypothetical protein [Pseudonocardia eucalypti]